MNSGLGKIGFIKWLSNTKLNTVKGFEDCFLDNTIEDILVDDFYKGEDLYNLLFEAFKAGLFFKE